MTSASEEQGDSPHVGDASTISRESLTPVDSRRIATHVGGLWLGSAGGALLGLLAQVVLARTLTKTEFGALAVATAFVGVLMPVAHFGVGPYWLKAFGVEGWRARRWIVPSVRFELMWGAASLAVLAVVAVYGPFERLTGLLILCLGPMVLGQSLVELAQTRLQLENRMGLVALWQFEPQLIRVIPALAAAAFGLGAVAVASGQLVLGLVATAVACATIERMRAPWFRLAGHGAETQPDGPVAATAPSVRGVFREVWTFGLSNMVYLIYFQADIVLLGWLRGSADAAIYSAAVTILTGTYLLPAVLYQRYLMPRMQRWAEHDPERMERTFRTGNTLMLAAGVAVAAIVTASARWVMPALFGARFVQSAPVLTVLALSIPIRYLTTSLGYSLTAKNQMRRRLAYQGVAMGANIVANLLVIPAWSYSGAAVVDVGCELILLALFIYAARRYAFPGRRLFLWPSS